MMKITKKLLSIFLALMVVLSTGIVLAASQTTDGNYVAMWDLQYRRWHYGEFPATTRNTTTGYLVVESDTYQKQQQTCYYGTDASQQWAAVIKEAATKGQPIKIDVNVERAKSAIENANSPDGSGYVDVIPGINLMIEYTYLDENGVEQPKELMMKVETQPSTDVSERIKTFKIDAGDTEDNNFLYSVADTINVKFVKFAVMNYTYGRNNDGKIGIGDFRVIVSPAYVQGNPAPSFGVEEDFKVEDYIKEDESIVESNNPGGSPDGPFGVDLKRDVNNNPYLAADPTKVATTKVDGRATEAPVTETTTTKAPLVKPGTPKLSSVKLTAKNKAKIKWASAANAKSYLVEQRINSGSWKQIKETTARSFTATKLAAGKKFTFRVRAKNAAGTGSYSSTKYVTTLNTKRFKVSLKPAKKAITVSWKKVTGATGYEVKRSLKKGSGFKVVKTTSKLSFKNSKLKSKTRYYYTVRAYNVVKGKKVFGKASSVVTKKAK